MAAIQGKHPGGSIGPFSKALLLARIWIMAVRIQWGLWRRPLPALVDELDQVHGGRPIPPALLSRAVSRGLRVGRWHPRCLLRSLVLFHFLRAQGEPAQLVIGLRRSARTADAHAWVELRGRDIGPLPGGSGHEELTRYPRVSGTPPLFDA